MIVASHLNPRLLRRSDTCRATSHSSPDGLSIRTKSLKSLTIRSWFGMGHLFNGGNEFQVAYYIAGY